MKTETSVQGFNELSMFKAIFEVCLILKSCLSIFQNFFLGGKVLDVLGGFKGFTEQVVKEHCHLASYLSLFCGNGLIFILQTFF